jgi:hypothetical protein
LNPTDAKAGYAAVNEHSRALLQSVFACNATAVAEHFPNTYASVVKSGGVRESLDNTKSLSTANMLELNENYPRFCSDASHSELNAKGSMLADNQTTGYMGGVLTPRHPALSHELPTTVERVSAATNRDGTSLTKVGINSRFATTAMLEVRQGAEVLANTIGSEIDYPSTHLLTPYEGNPVSDPTAATDLGIIMRLEAPQHDNISRVANRVVGAFTVLTDVEPTFIATLIKADGSEITGYVRATTTPTSGVIAGTAVVTTHISIQVVQDNDQVVEIRVDDPTKYATLVVTASNISTQILEHGTLRLTAGSATNKSSGLGLFGSLNPMDAEDGPGDVRRIWRLHTAKLTSILPSLRGSPSMETAKAAIANLISNTTSAIEDPTELAERLILEVQEYPTSTGPVEPLVTAGVYEKEIQFIILSTLNLIGSMLAQWVTRKDAGALNYANMLTGIAAHYNNIGKK